VKDEHEDKDWGDDEVVEPDDVIGPDDDGQPRTVRRGRAIRTAPDKWSRWSMYAGIASLGLLVLFPMLIIVLALASAALWFGFKANKQVDEADEPEAAKKRARVGMITGGLTMIGILGLVVYFNFFYEVPEKLVEFS
jgi:hypothetical protein